MIRPVWWEKNTLYLLDQTRLPNEELALAYTKPEDVAQAIETMTVRGAPAIGIAAAFALVLAALETQQLSQKKALETWQSWAARLARTRPTAINLFWAIQRMQSIALAFYGSTQAWVLALEQEALAIQEEDLAACQSIGALGATLLPKGARVLTHCNAGALATAGWGTALGIIRSAFELGKISNVFVDETRPFLQGSRLSAWELCKDKIPATLITDSMAGYFMGKGDIDAVIVGADRIARNGDVANKIGTYALSILAQVHDIPFYVAAPISTIDFTINTGKDIPIEERDPNEVKQLGKHWTAPQEVSARHPAFDVSPARNITAIITERGILRAPYETAIGALAPR